MIGHHGTNQENAKNILLVGFCKSEGYQWFGDGVYFFVDDKKEALNWAIKVKKFETNYAVIQSDIEVSNPLKLHKAKEWEEWHKLRGMAKIEAMKMYIKRSNVITYRSHIFSQ